MVHHQPIGSLAGHTLSQERVWYFTVQLIVLADSASGCRVYTRARSMQTTYTYVHVWGEAPHESRGNKPLHCKVPDPLLSMRPARLAYRLVMSIESKLQMALLSDSGYVAVYKLHSLAQA